MTGSDILREVEEVFSEVLERPGVKLAESFTSADVEGWDSLNHIQLVVAVEKRFRIRFTASQVLRWKNVGDMCADILKAVEK